jgi:hypothetical protein
VIFCDLLFKNLFCFFSVAVAEERRKIICTEDRKGHEEEIAGPWSHLFKRVAAQVDRMAFKESDSL